MRNCVVFVCLLAISAMAQEKTASQAGRESVVMTATPTTDGEVAVRYAPDDVKILGVLEYGKASDLVPYTDDPLYRAFVFSGYGGETVEVAVKSPDRKAFVAITDPSLSQIASGTSYLSVRLPYRGPDLEVWYIVFRDYSNQPAHFMVQVKKTEHASQQPQLESHGGTREHAMPSVKDEN